MAWSGMLVLVVQCGKFSLPEGDLIILFSVVSTIMAGFGIIHPEYEDSSSDPTCYY